MWAVSYVTNFLTPRYIITDIPPAIGTVIFSLVKLQHSLLSYMEVANG